MKNIPDAAGTPTEICPVCKYGFCCCNVQTKRTETANKPVKSFVLRTITHGEFLSQ